MSCVIFDLPLKRSIEADVLLANMRDILQENNNFKLILLVSLRKDVLKYKDYFCVSSTVSLIIAPKLTFPVETVWKSASTLPMDDYISEVVKTVLAIHVINEPGGILAFLPTIEEAQAGLANLNKKLTEYCYADVECVLIHERCHEKAILNLWSKKKHTKRIIVFATSCAEKLILPFVRYVVDCGISKDLHYDPDKNLEILATTFNSRSCSKLRRTFAGAFSTGICYRLYCRDDYHNIMDDREYPETLTKSPFNTMVKLFQYRQSDAVTVELIDPLPIKVKENAMKLLKNCNAIKDGELTVLGKDIVKLPFPARYSKLIVLGIQWGFRYEAVVIVAFFLVEKHVFQFSKDEERQREIDAVKLQLVQNESDPLTYLHIYQKWTENKYSQAWCEQNYINVITLQEVETKINELCSVVFQTLKEPIIEEFSDQRDCLLNMQEILFDCFQDNLCVFTGHHRSGYRMLSSQHITFLHPSSSLCQKDNLPQFVVFDHMLSTVRDFMVNVTSVPDAKVMSALQSKTLPYDYSNLFERNLVQRVIEPVGEMLMKHALLGKKGEKLREVEELIRKDTNNDLIVVEPSIEKGCVILYTLPDCAEKAESIIKDILSTKREAILKEEQTNILELKKGSNKISIHVQWRKGAKITSVNLQSNKAGPSGIQNNLTSSSNVHDVAEPAAVVKYSVNLMWPRRECIGTGYVSYGNPNDFMLARKQAMKYILIHDHEASIRVSKYEPNQLYITDLPPETNNKDLQNAMQKLIPDAKIEKVIINYAAAFETTTADIDNLRVLIHRKCFEKTNLTNFEVVIPMPNNTDIAMKAYINMKTAEEIKLTANKLNNITMERFKISAQPVYRTVVRCGVHVFKALRSQFEQKLMDLEDKLKISLKYPSASDLFDFVANIESVDTAILKLLSNHAEIIELLLITVNELLEGEVLDSNSIKGLHKLFCHGGHLWLRTLEKTANIFIIDEYKSKLIRLYGSHYDCSKAKDRIMQFLEDSESEAVKKIYLSNEKNNRMILKSIIKEYGVNLEGFIEKYELRSAVLNIRSCYLTLHGCVESIENAEEGLLEIAGKCDFNISDLLQNQEKCPVCTYPALQLTFRLEHCGHLYCFECIKGLVDQAKFPIQCCAENCDKDIVLEDIYKILDYNAEKINELLEKSLREYIEKNRTSIIYCPVPDCSMFFLKNDVPGTKWNCPLCKNEICIPCNAIYHIGFTCEMYQGSKNDSDYSFKVWQRANSNCKRCPICMTAIEKNEGCDHMTCRSCNSHFCWLCLKAFSTARKVYDHQPYCSRNQGI